MKPFANISLDLDNKWSYLKTSGDSSWKSYPSYLDIFIPYILDILDQHQLKITFFLVGKDASIQANHQYLKLITAKGHEIGNHGFHHNPAIGLWGRAKIEQEIMRAEEHIIAATGQKPVGFRSPGFCWSKELLEVLADRDYQYDASALPTFLAPLARHYYFSKANLSKSKKRELQNLYGSFWGGFHSSSPYKWLLPSQKTLYEIPVTTCPIIKMPIHFTYLLFLSRHQRLMYNYLKASLFLCKKLGTGLSYLLHPTDLLDKEQAPELSFFPGMDINKNKKREIFSKVIGMLSKKFDLLPMGSYLQTICNDGKIPAKKLHR